jgi:hypothetical protein
VEIKKHRRADRPPGGVRPPTASGNQIPLLVPYPPSAANILRATEVALSCLRHLDPEVQKLRPLIRPASNHIARRPRHTSSSIRLFRRSSGPPAAATCGPIAIVRPPMRPDNPRRPHNPPCAGRKSDVVAQSERLVRHIARVSLPPPIPRPTLWWISESQPPAEHSHENERTTNCADHFGLGCGRTALGRCRIRGAHASRPARFAGLYAHVRIRSLVLLGRSKA